MALVPLTLWFIAAVIRLEGTTRAGVSVWLHAPLSMLLMLSLVIATFWHMALGLTVVIEDYARSDATGIILLLVQRSTCLVAAIACILFLLRLGL